jgi:hypothetical protein
MQAKPEVAQVPHLQFSDMENPNFLPQILDIKEISDNFFI